ncbi:MAG: Putative NTE family protein RssA [Desulfonauticus sp. 38_4375]|nr:MAG: Putative NTE family protein RssA [Desulfonauticus sp. 38_4375]
MKTGIALGAGAAKGWAHIGILETLEEAGISFDYVAGTSIGALVGAVYAAGALKEFKQDILEMDWKKVLFMLDLVFPRNGLLDGKKVISFLKKYLPQENIEDLPVPFAAVSTDIYTGKEIVFTRGNLIEAVRASIAVPAIFTPVVKDKMCLVDGGLVNPLPVSVVREMGAEFVFAVNLNYRTKRFDLEEYKEKKEPNGFKNELWNRISDKLKKNLPKFDFPLLEEVKSWILKVEETPHIFEIMQTSITILEEKLTDTLLKLYAPDVLFRPPLEKIKFMDFHKGKEAISIGKKNAQSWLKKEKSILSKLPK